MKRDLVSNQHAGDDFLHYTINRWSILARGREAYSDSMRIVYKSSETFAPSGAKRRTPNESDDFI
jgi:hypothetical protein